MRPSKLGWMMLPILLCAGAARAETTLLDFYADWCAPCQAMSPVVDSLAREGYAVERVNIDRNRDLAVTLWRDVRPLFRSRRAGQGGGPDRRSDQHRAAEGEDEAAGAPC